MSSSDSETAEWEREQMLRGTQSRGRQQQHQQQQQQQYHQRSAQQADKGQSQSDSNIEKIDTTVAKIYVNQDIAKVQEEIESIKRNIGATSREIAKSSLRIKGIKDQIDVLESSRPFFESLEKLETPESLIECLDKHKSLIARLPPDQKEMINILDNRMRETLDPMVLD